MIREGRLGKGFDKDVASFTSSLDFDRDLFEYDIETSMAHLIMLCEQGIVEKADGKKILTSLKGLSKSGIKALKLTPELEDIHIAIEKHIIGEVGEVGGRLHTARSRNDQVATDLRMKARDDLLLLSKSLTGLVMSLIDVAEKNTLTVMPSYTHLQHAQPTTLAHHLHAYIESLLRSLTRLDETYKRMNLCPLGSGAVTTTTYPIDRSLTAELLGFEGVMANSMDAVSSRDYMIEAASVASQIATDISRIAEELILWSSHEFGFVELSDSFASTSSIMPQKKNPDILEIIRSRTSHSIGGLVTLLTMQRSLPQSYNRDLQEMSPVYSASMKNISTSLELLSKVVSTLHINVSRMAASCSADFSTATELADLITQKKKIPFRTAHRIVGAAVMKAVQDGKMPDDMDSRMLNAAAERITGKPLGFDDEEITAAMTPLRAVKSRKIFGGPAPERMEEALAKSLEKVAAAEESVNRREDKLRLADKKLSDRVKSLLE